MTTESSPLIIAMSCSVTELVPYDREIESASESQAKQSASESESEFARPLYCAVSATASLSITEFVSIVTLLMPLLKPTYASARESASPPNAPKSDSPSASASASVIALTVTDVPAIRFPPTSTSVPKFE